MIIRRAIMSLMGLALLAYTVCAATVGDAIEHADHIADKDFKHWFIYATLALILMLSGIIWIMWGQGQKVLEKLIELVEKSHELTGKTNQVLENVQTSLERTQDAIRSCRSGAHDV